MITVTFNGDPATYDEGMRWYVIEEMRANRDRCKKGSRAYKEFDKAMKLLTFGLNDVSIDY